MGMISKKLRSKCALHWLRLRYWYLDTAQGKRAQLWLFSAMVIITVVQVARLAMPSGGGVQDKAIWPVWVVQLIIAVISAIISYALRPKIEPPKPAEANTPVVEDGRAIPEVHGTCWIEDEFILAHKVVGRVPIKTGGKK